MFTIAPCFQVDFRSIVYVYSLTGVAAESDGPGDRSRGDVNADGEDALAQERPAQSARSAADIECGPSQRSSGVSWAVVGRAYRRCTGSQVHRPSAPRRYTGPPRVRRARA